MLTKREHIAEQDAEGIRLDVYVSQIEADLTRSRIQALIKQGLILLNDRNRPAKTPVKHGDRISIEIPEPQTVDLLAEDIPLDIVYEDADMIVINKARGMVVHPAAGNWQGTLVNALMAHCTDLSGIGGEVRPGIVHRIDKDTTGLLVVAKNDAAHTSLKEQIQSKTAKRIYWALVEGCIKQESGVVDQPIARDKNNRLRMGIDAQGRSAVTHYRVLQRYREQTLIEASLETGRTHQIRVHMAYLGHPLVGDATYGYRRQRIHVQGQLLHARELLLDHPRTGESMHFYAPIPLDFQQVLDKLPAV